MKSITKYRLLTLLLPILIMGCGKHAHDERSESGDWPEMDAFHMTMAEAYHPFKDSANLAPAKMLAEDLAKDADTWASGSIPEKAVDGVKDKLDKLKLSARAFADDVKKGTPDDTLGKELTALHHDFHEIMESSHGEKMEEH